MKTAKLQLVIALAISSCNTTKPAANSTLASISSQFDCNATSPEMSGFHNMVLFGNPDDELYVYHLPLFEGNTNGIGGHTIMHVYQSLWNVTLDEETKNAYKKKFLIEKTSAKPFPFFTIGPKIKKFKVPEMICNPGFTLSADVFYGHLEGNPDFPQPLKLVNKTSLVSVKGENIYGRKFDGSAEPVLTYFIFGTSKQYYMTHYLTDDEASFDQTVAIGIDDISLKELIEENRVVFVTVPISTKNQLVALQKTPASISPNNKWKLPSNAAGKKIAVELKGSNASVEISLLGEVYFNNNGDLEK